MLFRPTKITAGWMLAACCVYSLHAHAGPPLLTGDTDILDPGDFEVIVSATGTERDSRDSYELPRMEVSYGLTKNTQAAIILGRAVVDPPGASSKSDFAPLQLEYVWRWYARDNVTIAIAPAYAFPTNGSSHDRGIVDDIRELGVPLIATYAGEGWFITGETSYTITSSGPNSIGYGLATGYEISKKLTALAEINGGESAGGGGTDDRTFNWRIGGGYQVARQWALLFAYGGNLDSDRPGQQQINQEYYLGIQFNSL